MGKNKNKQSQAQPESTKLTDELRNKISQYMNTFHLPHMPRDEDWCAME